MIGGTMVGLGQAGRPGADGADGAAGAAGPSGQNSIPTDPTPGATPAPQDCSRIWPPGSDAFALSTMQTIEITATCRRNDSGARRTLVYRVIVRADALGNVDIDGTVQLHTPISTAGWAGTATVTFSTTVVSGVKKLLTLGTGPIAASSCTWSVDGARVRQGSLA